MEFRLSHLAAALAAIVLSAPVLAVTTTFSGSNVPNCTYNAPTKAYTCSALPLGEWDDKIAIADGYSVKVTGNVQITFNQGLTMSGTARLESTGNLDISALPQQNLSITGGSLVAGGSYKMGAQAQAITANITAGSMNLGGGSAITINGTLNSTGSITIPSHATINGNITSATGSINTNSPITISGNVTATQGRFEVPSGSTVTGNVKAKDVALLPSPSKVIGNVEASNSIEIGSGSGVQGNIKADSVVLHASEAYVTGTAQVNHITLGYHGTIQQGVACQAGDCSCVDNNSTYPVQCQPAAPALHHLRLDHSGSGLTCTPSTVTVNTCSAADSNGVCTAASSGVTGNVTAVAANNSIIATVPFSIASGASSVSVSVPVGSPQDVTFNVSGLSVTPASARTCWNGSSASCSHAYADSDLRFDILNHYAGANQLIAVRALKKGSNSQTCVPAFVGSRNIKFACSYGNPVAAQASQAPTVNGSSMGSTGGKCDAAGRTVALTFDSNGSAPATINYADAGQLSVEATDVQTGITGSDSFVAAPKNFTLATTATTVAAGNAYNFQFTARNEAGAAMPAFGKETSAPPVAVSMLRCTPTIVQGGIDGASSAGAISYAGGVGSTSLTWNETGTANIKVELPAPGYLGSGLTAAVTGNNCPLTSVPHHFDAEVSITSTYWYSGQPISSIKVTARNAGGGTTANFPKGLAETVDLSAWDTATPPVLVPASTGALAPNTIVSTTSVTAFANGVATVQPAFTFAAALAPPLDIRLRAMGRDNANKNNVGTEAAAKIRRGRLRLSNAFGSASANLQMRLVAEYWTGQSWLLNADDVTTVVPLAAIALTPNGPVNVEANGAVALSSGQGFLVLTKPTSGRGTVDVALNLGITSPDQACLGAHPASTGANLAWLRSRNGSCAATFDRDPSARASFGVSTPESRATVHFREVFN